MNIVDLLTHSQTIVSGRVEKVTDGFTAGGDPLANTSGKPSVTSSIGCLGSPRFRTWVGSILPGFSSQM